MAIRAAGQVESIRSFVTGLRPPFYTVRHERGALHKFSSSFCKSRSAMRYEKVKVNDLLMMCKSGPCRKIVWRDGDPWLLAFLTGALSRWGRRTCRRRPVIRLEHTKRMENVMDVTQINQYTSHSGSWINILEKWLPLLNIEILHHLIRCMQCAVKFRNTLSSCQRLICSAFVRKYWRRLSFWVCRWSMTVPLSDATE